MPDTEEDESIIQPGELEERCTVDLLKIKRTMPSGMLSDKELEIADGMFNLGFRCGAAFGAERTRQHFLEIANQLAALYRGVVRVDVEDLGA
jgi:hypothetical protein